MIYNTYEEFSRFEKEFFGLNKNGNLSQAWTNFMYQVENNFKDAYGNELTMEAIIESYKSYLIYWKRTYGQSDEKFISKENKLQNPEMFIQARMYQSLWSSPTTPREEYLFGDTTDEYRSERLKTFSDGTPKIKKKSTRKSGND